MVSPILTLLLGCSWTAVPIKGSAACLFFASPHCIPVYRRLTCGVSTWNSRVLAVQCYQQSHYQLLATMLAFDSSTVLFHRTRLPWLVSICTDVLPGDVLMSYYRHPKLDTDEEHMLSLPKNLSFWMLLKDKISFPAVKLPVLWTVQSYTNFLSSLRCFSIIVAWCAVHVSNWNIPQIK